MSTQQLEHSGTAWGGQRLPHQSSIFDCLDPRAKLLGAVLFIVAVAFSAGLPWLLFAFAIALLMVYLSKIAIKRVLRRLLAMESFMIFLLVLLPFTTPGEALFTFAGIAASKAGLFHAITIVLTANSVVFVLISLLGTMNAPTLGHALAYYKVPDKLIHTLLFMVRYIDVIGKEFRRMQRAMKARAYVLRFNRHTWRTTGYLVGMLLIRSLERSERIVVAMKCRGFNGRFYLIDNFKFKKADGFFVLIMAVLSLILLIGGRI